jgi:hypothetical protein
MSVVYSAEETSKVRAGGTAHTRWISAIPRATPNGATLQEQKHHLYKSTTVLGMFGWNCTGFYSQKASIDARQSLTHEVWKHLTSPLPVPCSRYLLLAGGESCTCQKAYSVCSVFWTPWPFSLLHSVWIWPSLFFDQSLEVVVTLSAATAGRWPQPEVYRKAEREGVARVVESMLLKGLWGSLWAWIRPGWPEVL